jgi:predicted nucleic acid-binding protein
MAVTVFVDTSVLLAGLVDFGPQSAPANLLLHAIAERQLANAATAWHCCLEFYAVATRLPPEFRLQPGDAARLLEEEVFGRMAVLDLPSNDRLALIKNAARDGIGGGRIYDAHIADVARIAGAPVIVTDNRRHFIAVLRHGVRVETPGEYVSGFKKRRS